MGLQILTNLFFCTIFYVNFTIRNLGHNREVRELVQSHRASEGCCQDLKLQTGSKDHTPNHCAVSLLCSDSCLSSLACIVHLTWNACSFPLHTSKF